MEIDRNVVLDRALRWQRDRSNRGQSATDSEAVSRIFRRDGHDEINQILAPSGKDPMVSIHPSDLIRQLDSSQLVALSEAFGVMYIGSASIHLRNLAMSGEVTIVELANMVGDDMTGTALPPIPSDYKAYVMTAGLLDPERLIEQGRAVNKLISAGQGFSVIYEDFRNIEELDVNIFLYHYLGDLYSLFLQPALEMGKLFEGFVSDLGKMRQPVTPPPEGVTQAKLEALRARYLAGGFR